MIKRKFWTSIHYAWQGIVYAAKAEPHMRVHVGLGFLSFAAGWWFQISRVEWLVVGLTVVMVLAVELMNTAMEVLVDLYSPQERSQAKIIKDLAAGAVLFCAAWALVVAYLVFGVRVFHGF